MEEALRGYHRDKYAASSLASRSSLATTWKDYHQKASAARPAEQRRPVFPLTPSTLADVAALTKLDNFRAFAHYLSWAKAEHIRQGYSWTQQLDLEGRDAGRSVNRGLGSARQSAAFQLEDLVPMLDAPPRNIANEPVFPAHVAILASLWVLREIEAAWACVGDLTVDTIALTVAWHLPVSKTDPRAKAVSRSWGCLCRALQSGLCPYHLFAAYLDKLKNTFNGGNDLEDDFPLFPDTAGHVCQKRAIVRSLEHVLGATGHKVLDPSGRKRFGGHSFRVSGSRFWTLRGLEVFKLQIFARWGSDTILRYVADIPLVNITGEVSGSSAASGQAIRELSTMLDTHVQNARDQIEVMRREIAATRGQLNPAFVFNTQSKMWHHVLHAEMGSAPSSWKALCGWRFGVRSHRLSPVQPGGETHWCDRCCCLFATNGDSDAGELSSNSGM